METRLNLEGTSAVTETDVWETCDRLAAENNRDFSCKEVRKELGHGSMTTIHRYVKTWRDSHPALPDLEGIPSDQFLAAYKAELKRSSTAREDKYKVQLSATTEDNEYLYNVLGETEKQLVAAERNLTIKQGIIESQKLQNETLHKTNGELKIAIADLQEKQIKAHEDLARLEIRLERISLLEKQTEALQTSLEKERTSNTALVADLAAAKAILAHLKTTQGSRYATRNSTAAGNEATPLDKQLITEETEALAETVGHTVAPEISAPKAHALSDKVIAASIVAITESGQMATRDIHRLLLAHNTIHAEQVSVKSLAAHLRACPLLTFDTATGSWGLSPSEDRFGGTRVGEQHEEA